MQRWRVRTGLDGVDSMDGGEDLAEDHTANGRKALDQASPDFCAIRLIVCRSSSSD